MRQDYGHQLDERSLEPLGQLLDLAHGRSGVLAEYRFEVVVEGVHVDTVQPEGDAKTGQNPLDIVAADLALLFRLRCHWDLAAVGAVRVHQVCLPSSLTPPRVRGGGDDGHAPAAFVVRPRRAHVRPDRRSVIDLDPHLTRAVDHAEGELRALAVEKRIGHQLGDQQDGTVSETVQIPPVQLRAGDPPELARPLQILGGRLVTRA
ncbi:hypothetical protein HRW14_30155 [Streptomyces lunaelactis]|uniref:hypothetical protein n=1 Tax=Streptomyces lunaelactis TaxID=1535768 RepID=UPI001584E0B8|nr:hypothetical protein [Streptomyces lunaelactis]NUK02856.1 hypothetical protein [Streptomyces lunaelactis]NUK19201.1 hypothetical protein [Streptomyces lunaelactis]NUK37914.1 hypothetical protein [Streptomyces lunaelactis]NUK44852.1 hypothetical protein [Streptomyces lunaelactis]NUK54454.1 hypothetical protein [Streptomyces lunaelactis]